MQKSNGTVSRDSERGQRVVLHRVPINQVERPKGLTRDQAKVFDALLLNRRKIEMLEREREGLIKLGHKIGLGYGLLARASGYSKTGIADRIKNRKKNLRRNKTSMSRHRGKV